MKTTEALRRMAATDPVREQPVQAADDLLDWVLFRSSLGDDLNDAHRSHEASERSIGSQRPGLRGSLRWTARSRRMRRPRWIIAVAVACAGAVAAFVLLPGGVSNPVDARAAEALLAAGRAAAAGVDAPLTGKDRIYSRTLNAYMAGEEGGDGKFRFQPRPPLLYEQWISHDGALLLRVVDAKGWRKQRPDEQQNAYPGHKPYEDNVNAGHPDFARTLPTDPVALEAFIRRVSHGLGENDDAEMFVMVQDMLLSPVSPSVLRAALFQVAAHLPNIEYVGQARDSMGRNGIAVAQVHGQGVAKTVLIFDPQNGMPLESQEYSLRPEEVGLPASNGTVLTGRTVWEESGVVAHDGLRPDGSQIKIRIQPEPKPGQH